MDPPAFAIPQENAHLYATRYGHATPQTMRVAFQIAIQLGMEPDRGTVKVLMDIVIEGIADLVAMPSEQPVDLHVTRAVHGIEATAKINGRTVHSELI